MTSDGNYSRTNAAAAAASIEMTRRHVESRSFVCGQCKADKTTTRRPACWLQYKRPRLADDIGVPGRRFLGDCRNSAESFDTPGRAGPGLVEPTGRPWSWFITGERDQCSLSCSSFYFKSRSGRCRHAHHSRRHATSFRQPAWSAGKYAVL